MITNEPTEDDIQSLLAAESLKGPRTWRGQPLAALSRGLKDLRMKVTAPNDTNGFFDLLLLEILRRACAEKPEDLKARRRELLIATDDVMAFRAEISLMQDELSDADIAEAKRLCDDLLGVVQKAEVELAEKKSDGSVPAELNLTMTPSTSPPLSAPDMAIPTTSAGSSL